MASNSKVVGVINLTIVSNKADGVNNQIKDTIKTKAGGRIITVGETNPKIRAGETNPKIRAGVTNPKTKVGAISHSTNRAGEINLSNSKADGAINPNSIKKEAGEPKAAGDLS